ncbi:MAG TPA: hypothetical protein VJI52_04245 [Candidatus Nanoarchaeia archaeon]|nr:hypothetical protein [Candidatus Nanoarchaeia archaeon]
MKGIKNIIILVSALLAFVVFVGAHSIFLFGISLDFDRDLKSNVISAAQKYLNTREDPIAFDLDRGLIIVHFDPDQRRYVEVNPLGYRIQGMHDDRLKHTQGTKTIKQERGLEIAKKVYDSLPQDAKSELKYDEDVAEVDDTYFYKWFRYVNGVLVAAEDFSVTVDAVNKNVIGYRLAIFNYPKNAIDTNPAITSNVAKKVAELAYNLQSVKDFEPYLIIDGDEPVWVTRLQGQFYPFYIGISAKDGSIAFSGSLPGDIPKNYHAGKEIKIVESDFIKNIYGEK